MKVTMTDAELTDLGNRGSSIRPAEVRALVAFAREQKRIADAALAELAAVQANEKRIAAECDQLKHRVRELEAKFSSPNESSP
jgi:hypothetical protein